MIGELKKQMIELPDRKEISLCEAVTAMIYGKAHDVKEEHRRHEEYMGKIESESLLGIFDKPTPASKQIAPDERSPANEQTAKLSDFLEQLREAAYAGRIKFRAIKDYGPLADGLKDIDPIHFYYEVAFNWPQDEISSAAEETPTVWCCVHLDRGQFASLLTGMGYSVRHSIDDVSPKLPIHDTGAAGRPSSMANLILPEAAARLEAGACPPSKTQFAEQLVDWLRKEHPGAPRPTAKSIRQTPAFQELWSQKGPKIINSS
jgi:hypothetical protein